MLDKEGAVRQELCVFFWGRYVYSLFGFVHVYIFGCFCVSNSGSLPLIRLERVGG